MSVRTRIRGLMIAAGVLLSVQAALAADSPAERALMDGRVDDAVALLKTAVAENPKDGRSHLLLCRAYYSVEQMDAAISECEAATANLLQSSEAQDWLGRAYGIKASRAGWYSGMKLVGHVRDAFESSVKLDAHNAEAVNDLGEFYIGAPGIVGGGIEKAEALADRVEAQLPRAAHRIRGLAAEHSKDYATAEKELHAAVAAGGTAEAWSDLAQFYARRHDGDRAVDAARHAVAADKANDFVLVDVASVMNELHREPQMAERALRTYLDHGTKTDAAPAFRARTELGKMLLARGDKAGAKIEFSKALQLASGYGPARKAMQGL